MQFLETRSEVKFKVTETQLYYLTLCHPKMHLHTDFEIPTSNNIRDMLRTRLLRGWTGGAGVRGWRVRNRGWRVRNRGWRGREAGVEGAGSGDRGGGEPGKIGAGNRFFYIENSKKMAVLCL